MPNPAVISDGLNALMLLQRGMEALQKNPPSTQGPAGPTIAVQAQQAAKQAMSGQPPQEPSAPPPPNQPQPQENGIAGIAQNVGTGAQIQAQQQQQAQQAMMAQAQQAQQPPQQMAKGGIASLNAHNMRGFKSGGVLGFAGPDGSDVPSAEELEAASRPAGLLRQSFERPSENTQLERAKAEAAVANALLQRYGSTQRQNDPQGFAEAKQKAEAAQKDLLAAFSTRLTARPEEGTHTVEAQKDTRLLPTAPPVEMMDTREMPQQTEQARPVRQASQAGPSAPRVPTSQSDLEGLLAAMSKGQAAVPGTDVSQQRALLAQLKAAREAQPMPGIEQLAAYRRAQDEYDTAAKERKESFGSRQFRELMRDFAANRNGEGMARVGDEERKLTEADTTRRLTNAQLSGHIVDVQNARKVGDLEKELSGVNAITDILRKDAELKAKSGESIASAFGNIAQQRISGETSAANNATQLLIAKMKIDQDNASNALLRQDQGFNQFQKSLDNNEHTRVLRLTEAEKAYNTKAQTTVEQMALTGNAEDKARAAEIKAAHAKELQDINKVYDQERQKILMLQYNRFGQFYGISKPPEMTSAPNPKLTGFTVTKE